MRKRILLTLSLLLLAGWLAAQSQPTDKALSDAEIGLSKTSVFDVPSPRPVRDDTTDPGERPVIPRTYEGSPPRISHSIADMLPITREENLCIDCHLLEERIEGEPTPIPASHKTDLRRSPERVGEQVVGARWVCVTCHVAQSAAEPLVGNDFGH